MRSLVLSTARPVAAELVGDGAAAVADRALFDTALTVNLKNKMTVFLFYETSYVDSKGVVHFADDYYGHDAQLEKALRHGYRYPRES